MFLWIRGDKRPALRPACEHIRTFLCLLLESGCPNRQPEPHLERRVCRRLARPLPTQPDTPTLRR